MKKKTVRNRILYSNALMVIVTLLLFLVINLAVVKIYTETIETEFKASVEQVTDKDGLEELLEDWTVRRDEFLLLFALDGVLCIIVLVAVSQIFTGNLIRYMMKPLNALTEGARRIRENELSQNIDYSGGIEFEQVCENFNDMQEHIREEQERNRKYEKARTDMIAGISHDLRTPLTAVRGTIKGLLDGIVSEPEQREKFLQTAYRRTGDMDRLLNQLFYLSRMETGNMPLVFRNIEIASFLGNYVEAKQEFLAEGKEELILETGDLVEEVCVDPEQLQRVLDNLLENSRKYAASEVLRMKITLSRTSEGVDICFADNGVGVPKEQLVHIFEEFYRGDASRSRKDGNGLGLYIVQYLMRAMKGDAWAESEKGLAIHLVLPVTERRGDEKDGE
jgi:signal transduction histidine kinase